MLSKITMIPCPLILNSRQAYPRNETRFLYEDVDLNQGENLTFVD